MRGGGLKPVGLSLQQFIDSKTSAEIKQAITLRQAWESVASESDRLKTGNAFYDKKNPDIVVIYTSDSADTPGLQAQKEIYRILLSEALRPYRGDSQIKDIRFVVSRNTSNRLSLRERNKKAASSYVEPVDLSEEEDRHARNSVADITDEQLKMSLYKAMKVNLEWKKGRETIESR
jgi:DNA polymerase elongation subunit (family B)